MGQELFNHSLFGQSADLRRLFVQLVQSAAAEKTVETIQRVIVLAVDRTADAIMDGPIYYRRPDGSVMIPLGGIDPLANGGSLEDVSLRDLIESLEVGYIEDPSIDPGAAVTSEVLGELQRRFPEDKAFITELVKQKVSDVRENGFVNEARIRSVPEVVTCGWASGLDLDFVRKFLSSLTKRFVRRCLGSPQDGKRVSRQKHEWDYVRGESAQWQQMLDAVKWHDDNVFSGGEALSTANVPLDVEGYTYGNFVDLAKCRKAVAKIRKVRRLVRKANVRETLSIIGQDIEEHTTNLVRSIDFTEEINELTAYFGD